MPSNRFIALHCIQDKYLEDIKTDGIKRKTKAVFIYDLENENENKLLNTLSVLIYHGIGIDGWNKLLDDSVLNNDIHNLQVVLGLFSKNQEKKIYNNNITNYYTIYNEGNTLNYCKIQDIGSVKKIFLNNRINIDDIKINNKKWIDPKVDRFFIKNIYSGEINYSDKTINEIKDICYKLAKDNIYILKEEINSLKRSLKKSANKI